MLENFSGPVDRWVDSASEVKSVIAARPRTQPLVPTINATTIVTIRGCLAAAR